MCAISKEYVAGPERDQIPCTYVYILYIYIYYIVLSMLPERLPATKIHHKAMMLCPLGKPSEPIYTRFYALLWAFYSMGSIGFWNTIYTKILLLRVSMGSPPVAMSLLQVRCPQPEHNSNTRCQCYCHCPVQWCPARMRNAMF